MTWLYAQTRSGGRRHPGRAATLLTRLGLAPPPTLVRVVGTNGKGSVTAMIAHGLSLAGRVTGRFLSPHVEEFRERIAVDGVPIGEAEVIAFVDRARVIGPFDDDLHPAFFDWVLALALEHFARAGVVTAVLEAGVGGASDATSAATRAMAADVANATAADAAMATAATVAGAIAAGATAAGATAAISNSATVATSLGWHGTVELVVLTNVTPEHLDTLGPTLADAARDKAGAFARGVPAVTGASGEALTVARRVAAEVGAPLYLDPHVQGPGTEPHPRPGGEPRPGPAAGPHADRAATAAIPEMPLDTEALFALPSSLVTPPAGTRAANARLAAASLRLLGVSERAVAGAIDAPPLPGRGERFQVSGVEVILDGAHDPAAAAALVSEVPPGYVLLFGALRRKQATATLRVLERGATAVVLTEAAAGEAPPEAAGHVDSRPVADPDAALALALELAAAGGVSATNASPRTVVIAGSLYLAGRLRPLLRALATPRPTAQLAGL